MKRFLIRSTLSFVAFMLCFTTVECFAQGWTGNINAFMGMKFLNEDEWTPVEGQEEIGIQLDFRATEWPFNIAIDFLRSSTTEFEPFFGVDVKGETTEIDVGIRTIWEQSPHVRPFLGGGLSFINAEFSAFGLSDDDIGLGIWLDYGVYWTLGGHFNIGLEGRLSTAGVNLFGVDANGGGWHIEMLGGFHW